MIICADFDDTIFLRLDAAQTVRNYDAIKKWRQKEGNYFILCTNRSFGSVESTLSNWRDYFDYLVLDGGAKVLNSSQEIIWSNPFDPQVAAGILDIVHDDLNLSDAKYYSLQVDDYTLDPLSDITKIYLYFENDTKAAPFLSAIDNLDANVLAWSHFPPEVCIEVTPDTTNKAFAIHKLISVMELPDNNVVTIGDNTNDYEMLTEFNGYAIQNSKISALHPDIRTTPSVADLLSSLG